MADVGGDFSALAEFAAELGRLEEVIQKTAQAAAPKLAARVAEGFANGRSPYGTSWAPLSPQTLSRGRSAPPLTDTGALSGAMRSIAGTTQIVLSAGTTYASFHQTGTSRMPMRQILPEDTLPETWVQDIVEACTDALARKLG